MLIEMQVKGEEALDSTFLYYASVIYSNQLWQGDEWNKLNLVYVVSVLECGFPEVLSSPRMIKGTSQLQDDRLELSGQT